MPKRPVIGFITCHVCSSKDAEVHEDKNGHAYTVCFDCNPPLQVFSRGGSADKSMRAAMRPVKNSGGSDPAAAAAAPPGAPPAAPAPAAAPVEPPKKRSGLLLD